MSSLVGHNLVPPRPKEQARYTIRELLILGLTLPIRFCPINKFGPEALGLDIVSLERMNENLIHYEREQMRQWECAKIQARKRMLDAAKAKWESENRELPKGGIVSDSSHETGDGDTTMIDPELRSVQRAVPRVDAFRSGNRPDSLHFQIPSSHSGSPLSINIGLSLDYTTPQTEARVQPGNRYGWKSASPKSSSSLSVYLKDAPTVKQPSPDDPTPDAVQSTPPTETTFPNVPTMSHGGDTPNSMAVERATEPSLRSYSPTSSIRAASEADYNEAVPALHLTSPTMSESVAAIPYAPNTPTAASVATLVAAESPQATVVGSPAKTESGIESGEESYIVVSSAPSESAGMTESSVIETDKTQGTSSSVPTVGKLLGRGKIDAKAQDDFIAFMMGKK